MLQNRNHDVVEKMKELKEKKLNKEVSDEEFDTQAKEIKGVKTAPVVLIKASEGSTYKNLIDALDEANLQHQ